MRKLSITVWLVALVLATQAGFCAPDPGPDPCDDDPLGCEEADPTGWQTETCSGLDAAAPLGVALGRGDQGFSPIGDDGAEPLVYFGAQGGQHTFLGVRVANARLDLYTQLRVTFWAGQGEGCTAPEAPTDEPPAGCTTRLTRRQVILGGRIPLETNVDGAVEQVQLLVFLSQPPAEVPTVFGALVEDPCGRVALDTATYLPGSGEFSGSERAE